MNTKQQYRVLVFKEDGIFYAQCLEADIGTFAEDLKALKERFLTLFEIELGVSLEQSAKPFGKIDPAPKEFHDMWNSAKRHPADDETRAGMPLQFAHAA